MGAPGLTTETFAAQVAALRGFLWDHAMALARGQDEADDLVHDTIERALSSQHLFRPGSNLRGWMRSIMRNIFIDGWRRQPHYVQADIECLPDACVPAADLEVGPLDVVRMEHVRSAVARLPAHERQLFTLAYGQGASYREIARRCHLTLQTVGTRMFRIRHKIRVMLERSLAAEALTGRPGVTPPSLPPERTARTSPAKASRAGAGRRGTARLAARAA